MNHLDDAALMAVIDGEPGAEHLRECAQCRARYQALENALGEFTALHRGSKGHPLYTAYITLFSVPIGLQIQPTWLR